MSWDRLEREIDAWAAAGREATLWWRDDDAVAATAELERLLGGGEWFTASGFGLADIAAGCALGYLDLRLPEFDWRSRHPALARYFARLDARPSFSATRPEAQPVATGR